MLASTRLYRLFHLRFGLGPSIKLYRQYQNKRFESLQLPGIKYPFSLRPNTTDSIVFDQVFLYNHYDISFDNPKFIVDAGANIGLFTVLMKNKYPDAAFVCIEPDGENFAQLQKNVAPYPDVSCEHRGLWNKDTTLRVYDKFDYGKFGMMVEEDEQNGTVPAISIDTILKKYAVNRIDVLKIDIESSERNVFSANYENWLPKVKTVVIELHDWMEEGCAKAFFNAINQCFTRYKFTMFGESVIIENLDLN